MKCQAMRVGKKQFNDIVTLIQFLNIQTLEPLRKRNIAFLSCDLIALSHSTEPATVPPCEEPFP